MQHLQAHASALDVLYPIPPLGTQVTVDSVENRGYVSLLTLMLETARPEREVVVENLAVGGFTSRDVLRSVKEKKERASCYSLAFVGCGTNDVWRAAQDRPEEAVGESEYRSNIGEIVELLEGFAHHTILLAAPPMNPTMHDELNKNVARYNRALGEIATTKGCVFIDIFTPLLQAHTSFVQRGKTLWVDDAHLSPLGDCLVAQHIFEVVKER